MKWLQVAPHTVTIEEALVLPRRETCCCKQAGSLEQLLVLEVVELAHFPVTRRTYNTVSHYGALPLRH